MMILLYVFQVQNLLQQLSAELYHFVRTIVDEVWVGIGFKRDRDWELGIGLRKVLGLLC
jgi:hypothetical protein